MALAIKDPGARIDYAIDWSVDYLDAQHIVASSWAVTPVEADGVGVDAASHSLLRTAVQVSGGRAGRVYQLTNRVELSDGQRDERSIAVRVDAR
jgi:hypothetical protein